MVCWPMKLGQLLRRYLGVRELGCAGALSDRGTVLRPQGMVDGLDPSCLV